MCTLDKDSFIRYIRNQWAAAGYDVSEATDAPYKETVKALADGFSFGLSLSKDDVGPGNKARVGVWFRPVPKGGIAELASLRTHYQQKLQQQGRGCRIHNCGTEFGSFFLFFETTAPLSESVVADWAQSAEELSSLCFDPEALDNYLADYR
jgi:hypothetical protein